MARRMRAGRALENPSPNNGTNRISNAYDGTARPSPATAVAICSPRPVWPIASPAGMAIATPISTARPDMTRCSPTRQGTPFVPDQWAGSRNQVTTSPTNSISRPARATTE